MKRILAATAALWVGVTAASACEFQQSASKQTDRTVVASIETTQTMSTPQTTPPPEPVKAQSGDQKTTAD